MIKRAMERVLNAMISPAYYIVVSSSLLIGILAVSTTSDIAYKILGVVLIIGAMVTLIGFRNINKRFVSWGALISYLAWLFLAIFLFASGSFVAIAILAVPYFLLFSYFYIGCNHEKFWRM